MRLSSWEFCFLLISKQMLLTVLTVNAEDEFDSCPTSNSETAAVKLRDSVLCNYDQSVRPVANHQNSTAVSFRIILKYFMYEPTTSTLSIDAWLTISWKDEHLTWKPEQHQGIKYLHLHANEIWTPDLSVYNLANQGESTELIYTKCVITNEGAILCVPPVRIDALCIPDLTKYPFDTHNCSLRLGSWVHNGEELDIKLIKNVVSMEDLTPNGEWEIAEYKATRHPGNYKCCPNTTYPSIDINFKIKRLSGAHAATIIIPTAVVVMLTFTALSMSPLDKERLMMCYVNLFAQYLQMQYVSWQIPLKSDNLPLLILYSRDSLLLSFFALMFTVIFKSIMQKKTIPPAWVSGTVSLIIGCRPGQIVFLNDFSTRGVAAAKGEEDGTTIINSEANTNSQDWELFGKILDKVLLLCYIIVYFIMTITFLP